MFERMCVGYVGKSVLDVPEIKIYLIRSDFQFVENYVEKVEN